MAILMENLLCDPRVGISFFVLIHHSLRVTIALDEARRSAFPALFDAFAAHKEVIGSAPVLCRSFPLP
jgi:hypothetical protein